MLWHILALFAFSIVTAQVVLYTVNTIRLVKFHQDVQSPLDRILEVSLPLPDNYELLRSSLYLFTVVIVFSGVDSLLNKTSVKLSMLAMANTCICALPAIGAGLFFRLQYQLKNRMYIANKFNELSYTPAALLQANGFLFWLSSKRNSRRIGESRTSPTLYDRKFKNEIDGYAVRLPGRKFLWMKPPCEVFISSEHFELLKTLLAPKRSA